MKAVNLLPSEQRGSAKTPAAAAAPKSGGSASGAYVVLGVLAFAVAAVAVYVLASNTIKEREAELATVTRQAQETQAKAAQLQAYADFATLATQRVATVRDLAASRFDWERTLRDLSRALPSDVHLTALDGSVGTQVAGGSGGSALRSAVQAPALELSGCTKDQASIARMMSRLRSVRGVTRVTLGKSDKDNTNTTVVTSTDGTENQLCPNGAPPTFDAVVFFERAAVGANAVPNAPGATTPTAGQSATTPPAGSSATTTTSATPGTSGATQGVSSK